MRDCEHCGERPATRIMHDAFWRIWHFCEPCWQYWDNYEPPDPDYNAPTARERYEQAAEQKRRLG